MIPLRVSNLKYAGEWPDKIIIHHTVEFTNAPKFKFDVPKFQAGPYIDASFKIMHKPETMYHFIIEKVGTDYHAIVSQPLLTKCEYEDLNITYHKDIHIGLMGDYNLDFPQTRMYKVLAYRVLVPLMRMFYLEEKDILLHSAISNDETINCPGEFIDMTKLLSQLRSVRKKRIVRKG